MYYIGHWCLAQNKSTRFKALMVLFLKYNFTILAHFAGDLDLCFFYFHSFLKISHLLLAPLDSSVSSSIFLVGKCLLNFKTWFSLIQGVFYFREVIFPDISRVSTFFLLIQYKP